MGTSVSLRPVAEDDLEEFHSRVIDIEARGPVVPTATNLTHQVPSLLPRGRLLVAE